MVNKRETFYPWLFVKRYDILVSASMNNTVLGLTCCQNSSTVQYSFTVRMIAGTSVVFDSWRFLKKRRFFSIETHNFSPSVNCLNVTPSESVGSLVNASCYRMAKLRSVGTLHPPRILPTFKKLVQQIRQPCIVGG